MEALRLKALLEKEVLQAIEKGNKNILRYLVNRLYRIRKSVEVDVLQKVSEGDSKAVESALRTMLLSKWEGPIVKFLDKDRQARMIKGEKEHIRFIANNLDWIDPNVQAMKMEGNNEGIRMTSNQIHYKSLRNLKGKEYHDDFKMKSYAQALAVQKFKGKTEKQKIPNRAKASEIWLFFSRMGRVMDIILPRKRDRFDNRIGFIKTDDVISAEKIIKNLKSTPFLGSLLDYQYIGENKKSREGVKNKGKEDMYDEDKSAKKTLRNENSNLRKEGVLKKKLENLEKEVLIEEGFSNILVKEISCWKFLLKFKDDKDKILFDKSRIKHWLHGIRNIEEEDHRIKRKMVVEARRKSYIAWTEDTLMDITKNLGDWGWWINEVEENKIMENPKVCIYFAELFNISNKSSVTVKGVGYEVGIVEIPFDFHMNESSIHSFKDKSATSKVEMDKEKSKEEQKTTYSKEDDLSNVFRISGTFDNNERRFEENSPQRDISISKAELVSDFPKSIDKNSSIIDTGIIDDHGDSQSTLCQMLDKVKIKGPGRPKQRKKSKNPFEIGRCKLWLKSRKGSVHENNKGLFQKGEGVEKQPSEVSEAKLILESALDIGLILKEDNEKTLETIKEQLAKSQI
ncbi:hypothetical protein POM88_036373 [Heracleum sosnowskyi]|uniref:RRM domain-containing protein n=1 Tax=Heracleum sosnowskyi TaxID=360622 RepID=A0AAD8HN99_9APIA|nr:hypothetical protein POM88_036373 [Heracleum sosnowskyi]